MSRYIGFLNLREQELAKAALNSQRFEDYCFNGGYEGAERLVLGLGDTEGGFPIVCARIDISGAKHADLTHRDFLGAIMGAGITRESVGDIITDEKGAYVFLHKNIYSVLENSFCEVGRYNAKLSVSDESPEKSNDSAKSAKASVASLRLDVVLAAMLNLSRGKATELITQGLASVNHMQMQSLHYNVCEGDVFSIRGTGKFKLVNVGGTSRKNRIWIEFIQY